MNWFNSFKKTALASKKGAQQETLAAHYLQEQGLKILAQNFTAKGCEIDLIALSEAHQRLHFIEVKARQNSQFGHPAEFVNSAKQQRITHCAQHFLQQHPQYLNHSMQFDVMTFLGDFPSQKLEWLQNAFGGL
ncbi:YraN family protein [Thiosulfativibrio zosterae]|uniref:UPF0102 protein THMIRHAT_05120 n=1 Tax=Thiosulfativibrio zosterae TaxID=2675053 RepID=A0A6F8PL04_9GAMM|nr:YraN family protein [Thiosulfativibrio zosterae]BBP42766.1 UPF0102 protein [Thiosulfativibrio zosterae]